MSNFNMVSNVFNKKIIAVGVSCTLTACATVDTDFDKKIGAENSIAVAAQMGLYHEHDIDTYVKRVGNRLVSNLEQNEFQFHFEVVDEPIPNAFALPGGYIYITRGLLSLMQTEDELACVLAHEIIHVTARHSVKQMQSGVLPSLIEAPGNIVGSVIHEDLGNLINAPVSVSNDLLLAGYSRSHETESDTKGVALAAKSGYDPTSMNDILTRLNTAVEFVTESEQEKSYFDDHPFTPDRVDNINHTVESISYALQPNVTDDFLMELDGLVVGENPNKGVFEDNVFMHPTMNFAIDFPLDWQTVNQPQAVAAVTSAQDSMIALSTVRNRENAEMNAFAFQMAIKEEYGKELEIYQEKMEWGGKSYFTTVQFEQKSVPMTIVQSWIDLGDVTYQIVTVGTNDRARTLENSRKSLRPLSQEQLSTIAVNRVKIIEAEKSSSFKSVVEESKNVAPLELISIMNQVDLDQVFAQNQSLKVIEKTHLGE